MDDLYRYVYAKVKSEGYQEPMRWALNVKGEDVWHDDYKGAPSDGSAWLSGGDSTHRVLRGVPGTFMAGSVVPPAVLGTAKASASSTAVFVSSSRRGPGNPLTLFSLFPFYAGALRALEFL
jgi:hypothetical protein